MFTCSEKNTWSRFEVAIFRKAVYKVSPWILSGNLDLGSSLCISWLR
jgi:hypothetical protein